MTKIIVLIIYYYKCIYQDIGHLNCFTILVIGKNYLNNHNIIFYRWIYSGKFTSLVTKIRNSRYVLALSKMYNLPSLQKMYHKYKVTVYFTQNMHQRAMHQPI